MLINHTLNAIVAAAMLGLALLLAGCVTGKPDTIKRTETLTVNKPVLQPCVGHRPTAPDSLVERYSDEEWQAMRTIDMIREAGTNAIAWLGYGKVLERETSQCPEVGQ